MGLSVRRLARRVRERAALEVKYIKEDVRKVTSSPRRSVVIAWAGALVIAGSLAAWQPVVGGVVLGIFLIIYGLIFIDVDRAVRRRGR